MQDEPNQETQGTEAQEGQEQSFYNEGSPDNSQTPQATQLPTGKEVSWTASEYIHHHKSSGWYVALVFITILVSGLMYLIVRDMVTVVAIVVVAISFGFFASRAPRTLDYRIDSRGITIGEKLYPYGILRTFSIQQEGAIKHILLIPLKRFMPAISMYYPPEQEEEIINTISDYMPHEERRADPIDSLMHRVRF